MLVNRLPNRSDIIQTYLVCVFVVHTWAFISFLNVLPSYILRYKPWDTLGILAYSQAFALLESLLTLCILLLLSILLPKSLLKEKFVAQGSLLVFITAAWSAWYAWYLWNYSDLSISKWFFFVSFVTSYILTLIILSYLIRRIPKLEGILNAFAEKLIILSTVYMIIGVLSFFLITLRNLT